MKGKMASVYTLMKKHEVWLVAEQEVREQEVVNVHTPQHLTTSTTLNNNKILLLPPPPKQDMRMPP